MKVCQRDLCGRGSLREALSSIALVAKTIKAFHLNDERSLQWIEPYCGKVRAFLFDTHSEGKRGGTGKTFDWDLAIKSKGLGVPVILAGGLSPSNIRQAILTVQPYAVDVNSGVEEHPGKKSHTLMKELFEKTSSWRG